MHRSFVRRALVVHAPPFQIAKSFYSFQGDYDEKLAYKFVAHAAAAYCHPDNITDWDCPVCQNPMLQGFEPYKTFRNPNGEIFGYIGIYKKGQYSTQNESKNTVLT